MTTDSEFEKPETPEALMIKQFDVLLEIGSADPESFPEDVPVGGDAEGDFPASSHEARYKVRTVELELGNRGYAILGCKISRLPNSGKLWVRGYDLFLTRPHEENQLRVTTIVRDEETGVWKSSVSIEDGEENEQFRRLMNSPSLEERGRAEKLFIQGDPTEKETETDLGPDDFTNIRTMLASGKVVERSWSKDASA